jgi:hypothetical protein
MTVRRGGAEGEIGGIQGWLEGDKERERKLEEDERERKARVKGGVGGRGNGRDGRRGSASAGVPAGHMMRGAARRSGWSILWQPFTPVGSRYSGRFTLGLTFGPHEPIELRARAQANTHARTHARTHSHTHMQTHANTILPFSDTVEMC